MLTKAAINHMSRGNGKGRRTLQMFLAENRVRSLNRVLRDPGTQFKREKGPEYLMVGSVPVTPNPAPYVYRPMFGHAPGRKV